MVHGSHVGGPESCHSGLQYVYSWGAPDAVDWFVSCIFIACCDGGYVGVSFFKCVYEAPGLYLYRCFAVPCVIVEVQSEDDVFALVAPLFYVLFEVV
jgi:hypothetical protein